MWLRLILGGGPTAMIRPRGSRLRTFVRGIVLAGLLLVHVGPGMAQPPKQAPETPPGQFFTITEPITHATLEHIRASTRQLVDRSAGVAHGKEPVLVFEFRPG